ncbi:MULTISPECIES: MZA anti-phage system associated Z1 domain-containing protein MzaC [Salmonella]|uniref:Z1 domain-containing protein n=3 Tax=Enterobacteriaceae TaxID=543 RepID=A0A762D444_SALER|nr:MZA anti-phage system associated Z1 domain-containing protein MzaC [Salmonella enterica]EAA7885065.1 endonuclease [Salmonella enterica subsp. enterica]EAA7926959.1 endonuclease [Salmonella enterica subsp. enterica serovar Kottbus]MCL9151645.1 Z1 domain-containing protein [Salmonella enterica subsp. enterica serovar Enteritidis]AXD59060.1 endonuclease [Salmonella enterica]EAB8633089.1 endonuclease [Salmonella enterica subsp. enterica]
MSLNPLDDTQLSVLQIVQTFLQSQDKSTITPGILRQHIDMVCQMKPEWSRLDSREILVEELIRRYSIWMGEDSSLSNDEGHQPWLTADVKREWRYWHRYRQWLGKTMPWGVLDTLDRSTDRVLGLLEQPGREGRWDRRGLVVGHVQSGKTSHYTGLICKAADAGYKIIIVLAGLHNNLRSQTQMRLDEGFLGYETSPLREKVTIIGVGDIDSDPVIRPNYVTNRSEKGDFSAGVAKNLGISPEQRPWLFVVKKNKSILKRLHTWIENHVATSVDPITGKRFVSELPLLMIDDEADNASVDTGEIVYDDDGKPDAEHQPTAINSLIRKLLMQFSRKAYVGYTATPFANIFIHESNETRDEGPDLFPSAFIINLGAPSNYIGPARVFGRATAEGRSGELPLIRRVSDHCSDDGKRGWMPVSHKSSHYPTLDTLTHFPDSLKHAIDSFLLACCVRELRGQGEKHSSMLVHVTRFNKVQSVVYENIDAYIQDVRQRLTRRIGHEPFLHQLESLWQADFLPTNQAIRDVMPQQVPDDAFEWQEIVDKLYTVIENVSVRMINGTAKDALDYSDSATGLKVIAIGGDKLARGLTLEGLCTSYFLRASRMYDTLMQMGRWFGYRQGYLDVCRLYTTDELIEWFEHIADASEELREEFDNMVASGGTPRDFGLKVKSHPVLMVTSPLKMRSARSLWLSFSGTVVETISLFKEQEYHKRNYVAFQRLTGRVGAGAPIPERRRGDKIEKWNGVIWQNISPEPIIDFLTEYETHAQARKANSKLLADFVTRMNRVDELTQWTVAVIGGGIDRHHDVCGFSVPLMMRKASEGVTDRYSIGRLLSPRDEGIDCDESTWLAALEETQRIFHADPGRNEGREEPVVPGGVVLRRIKGFGINDIPAQRQKGLLLIYLLDPQQALSAAEYQEDALPVVAFGISFPGSRSGVTVEYKVNNVLWEQEYGAAE